MSARALRFDQGAVKDVVITAVGLTVTALFFALGRYLRAVDDRLADFD